MNLINSLKAKLGLLPTGNSKYISLMSMLPQGIRTWTLSLNLNSYHVSLMNTLVQSFRPWTPSNRELPSCVSHERVPFGLSPLPLRSYSHFFATFFLVHVNSSVRQVRSTTTRVTCAVDATRPRMRQVVLTPGALRSEAESRLHLSQ